MSPILRRVPITAAAPTNSPFWADAKSLIDRCAVTAIVGNFLGSALVDGGVAALAELWASENVLMAPGERSDLARVAQYHSMQQKNRRETKYEFLRLLKEILYAAALDDTALDEQLRSDLKDSQDKINAMSLSEFARMLSYPRFEDLNHNPLRLMAELPLPLFITTSYHDFLEYELAKTNRKQPVSEILYWDQALENIPSIYDTEPQYKPSVDRPLVYHLFGRDAYPESIVLTEDDYLDCLVELSELRSQVNVSNAANRARLIPNEVRTALSTNALLLLGYHVNEWDFRVLFRGLILGIGAARTSNPNVPRGICMQVNSAKEEDDVKKRLKEHFETYFDKSHFDVFWGDELDCVRSLCNLWKGGS
jgi:hypothetical protein